MTPKPNHDWWPRPPELDAAPELAMLAIVRAAVEILTAALLAANPHLAADTDLPSHSSIELRAARRIIAKAEQLRRDSAVRSTTTAPPSTSSPDLTPPSIRSQATTSPSESLAQPTPAPGAASAFLSSSSAQPTAILTKGTAGPAEDERARRDESERARRHLTHAESCRRGRQCQRRNSCERSAWNGWGAAAAPKRVKGLPN